MNCEDASGTLSEYSDSISFTLLNRIGAQSMTPNGLLEPLNDERTLSWQPTYGMEIEKYTLTINTEENKLVSRDVFLPGNYVGGTESWQIPTTILLAPQRIYKWRIDIGSRYLNGHENAGSESRWVNFLYVGD
jgi:hypothetical protein